MTVASGTIQNPNIVTYRDVVQLIDSFDAGEPGSRAAQYTITGVGISGYSIISATVKNHLDSATMNLKPFLQNSTEDRIYLNVYRASGAKYTAGDYSTVKIRIAYLRN